MAGILPCRRRFNHLAAAAAAARGHSGPFPDHFIAATGRRLAVNPPVDRPNTTNPMKINTDEIARHEQKLTVSVRIQKIGAASTTSAQPLSGHLRRRN